MRRISLLASLLLALAGPVLAQTTPPPPPPAVEPQPSGLTPIDSGIEPQVTIRKREGEMVEEHRVNGKLYKVVVRPENAPPYTLVDPTGEGKLVPLDGPGDKPFAIPMWTILTF